MAVGYGAKAGKDSISIGAFSGGGIDSSAEIVSVPDTTPKPSSGKPNHIIGIGVGVAMVVLGAIAIYIIKTHDGIPKEKLLLDLWSRNKIKISLELVGTSVI